MDSSCGTDPALEFHQVCKLRKERSSYSGQLLREASTLRYYGDTILTGAAIMDNFGTF